MAVRTFPTSAIPTQVVPLPAGRAALLALLTAGLLWAGWPVHPAGLALLLLVAWVPLLWLERRLVRGGSNGWRVFRYAYLALVLWNAFTTYWVSYSTLGGGIAAVVLNALLMSAPFMAFYHTKRQLGPVVGYLSLPIYWIAFEQLHLHWDLTWPWLTLGNGFAQANQWVQWYEYTGFLGGSLWIWTANLLAFFSIKNYELKIKSRSSEVAGDVVHTPGRQLSRRFLIFNFSFLIATAVPVLLSYFIGSRVEELGPTTEVVVVQPNIDPWGEKFAGTPHFMSHDAQLDRLFHLTEQQLTPQTSIVFWPETALEETYSEQALDANPKIQRVRGFLARHPGLSLVTGITSFRAYPNKEAASPTARFRDDVGYYDIFNAAVFFPAAIGAPTFYHKSRLVPGVEKVPPLLTQVIANIDLGGMVGSYGSQAERTVFRGPADPALRVAPLICYESIYGDFVAEYVQNGATLLSIITNDGWWSNSPGHAQHLQYATLRAIETRRDVARSANTGISAYINQKGEIVARTPWWQQAALRHLVHLNTEQTFYVRHGELIGPAAQVLAVLLLVWLVVAAVGARRPRPSLTQPNGQA